MARPDLYYSLAHRYVQVAKDYGHLSDLKDGKTPCADCGQPAVEYDHRDYMKPLDVAPVCRACNQARGDGANKDVATAKPTILKRFRAVESPNGYPEIPARLFKKRPIGPTDKAA